MDDIKEMHGFCLCPNMISIDGNQGSKNKLKFVDYVSDNDLLAKNSVCIKRRHSQTLNTE